MPDEIDVPLENAQDKVYDLHQERHGGPTPSAPGAEHEPDAAPHDWTRFIALSTALLAVVAALGALQSGLLINDSLIQKNEQVRLLTQEADTWNEYQADGIKGLIYATSAAQLPPGSAAAGAALRQAGHYKDKQPRLKQAAQDLETRSHEKSRESTHLLESHHVFAFSVSLCQIAIALSAVAALTRRRRIWIASLIAGAAATLLLVLGFLGVTFGPLPPLLPHH